MARWWWCGSGAVVVARRRRASTSASPTAGPAAKPTPHFRQPVRRPPPSLQVVHPRPTPGTLEIDPSYAWVQSTLGGVGLARSPRHLHADMHAYLRSELKGPLLGVDGQQERDCVCVCVCVWR